MLHSPLLLAATLALAPQRPELPDAAAVSASLRRLASARPDLVALSEYGTSAAGRPLELVRLGAPEDGRPGLLIVGGLDAEHPFEPWLCAQLAERLATDEAASDLLASYTVYVLPLADPDGLTLARRGGEAGAGPDADSDRDGRRGEDPAVDLDGDGLVLHLVESDPEGAWIHDPHDARAFIERESLLEALSESPEFLPWLAPGVERFTLHTEGRDADGDGRAAEDPAGDRRFDANFPAGWPEHEPRAGIYATGDPAVRALCDWIVEHEDVTMVLAFGAADHLRTPFKPAGKGQGRVPATGPTESDLPWLEELAERAREATGIESGRAATQDLPGHFVRWAYDHRGLWTLGLRPFALPTKADAVEPEPASEDTGEADDAAAEETVEAAPELPGKPSDDAGRLAWIDQQGEAEAWRFRAWSDFEHPELGSVRLGGFTPGAHSVPPVDGWADEVDRWAAFLVDLADTPARLSIERARAEQLGDGLWRVRADVVNHGFLPSTSSARVRAGQGRATHLTLALPDGAELLAGGTTRSRIAALDGGAATSREWLVRCSDPTTLRLELVSPNAGLDQAAPTIEEVR